MKTTSQIYQQGERLSTLLHEVTTAQIKKVNPETGGNILCAHNWGNKQANAIISQYRDRQSLFFKLVRKHYHAAFCKEYPEHLSSKVQMY